MILSWAVGLDLACLLEFLYVKRVGFVASTPP